MKIKGLLAVLLAGIMLFSFCACKEKTDDTSSTSSTEVKETKLSLTKKFPELEGIWKLKEGKGLIEFVFSGHWWNSYDENGYAAESGMKVEKVKENENLYRYDLYDIDGDLYLGLYLDNDSKFHIADEQKNVYEKVKE